MDNLGEVKDLLVAIRELAGHPNQYGNLRAALAKRLAEIDAEAAPPPAEEPVVEEPAEETDDEEETDGQDD